MYAFRTHRIWSRVVLSPVLMAGIATFTIVVSSRIMKNPVVKTSRTSHGLVRACAMSPPQPFNVAHHSGAPLQPSIRYLVRDLANPFALRFQHRDLVLQLDQSESLEAVPLQLVENSRELGDGRPERCLARLQVSHRLRRLEVMHEHQ